MGDRRSLLLCMLFRLVRVDELRNMSELESTPWRSGTGVAWAGVAREDGAPFHGEGDRNAEHRMARHHRVRRGRQAHSRDCDRTGPGGPTDDGAWRRVPKSERFESAVGR